MADPMIEALLLTFYHGLRVSELCNLKSKDLDLPHGRLWIARLKGSLSTGTIQISGQHVKREESQM